MEGLGDGHGGRGGRRGLRVLPQLRREGGREWSRTMSGNRPLRMLWLIITAAWVLRNVVALAEGRPMELEPMLLALVLMKLYEKEE